MLHAAESHGGVQVARYIGEYIDRCVSGRVGQISAARAGRYEADSAETALLAVSLRMLICRKQAGWPPGPLHRKRRFAEPAEATPAARPHGRLIPFAYDQDGQMTSESAGGARNGSYTQTYAYDAAGNTVGTNLSAIYLDSGGTSSTSNITDTPTLKSAEGYENQFAILYTERFTRPAPQDGCPLPDPLKELRQQPKS